MSQINIKDYYNKKGLIELNVVEDYFKERGFNFKTSLVSFFAGHKMYLGEKEYFIKYNSSDPQRTINCETEVLLSRMARKLGLDSVEYVMAKQTKKTISDITKGYFDYCTISEDCTKNKDYRVIKARDVLAYKTPTALTCINKTTSMAHNSVMGFQEALKTFEEGKYTASKEFNNDLINLSLFDYFTSQMDRHESNYFVKIDESKQELVGVIPMDYEIVGSKDIWELSKFSTGEFLDYKDSPQEDKNNVLETTKNSKLFLGITEGGVTPEQYLEQLKTCNLVDKPQVLDFVTKIKEESFFKTAYEIEKETGYKICPDFVALMDDVREERLLQFENIMDREKEDSPSTEEKDSVM